MNKDHHAHGYAVHPQRGFFTAWRWGRWASVAVMQKLTYGITGFLSAALLFATMGSVWARPLLATAPPLGTATSFAVLATSTVTNTGPTVVTGDLGVSPGTAVTGFPPGLVVGGTIHAGDAVAAGAQADATVAYNNLAGQACNTNLTGQDLGGLTLTPGVYCFSSSAQLTGILTLDGQGDPNAVFVFQIGSTLTTASASSVVLINGASACNVFFQVGSSATLGTGTLFQGNILALASDTLTTGVSVIGRVFALTGAVTMDTNTVSGCTGTPATPTNTPVATNTNTPVATNTNTPVATNTNTPVATLPPNTTTPTPTAKGGTEPPPVATLTTVPPVATLPPDTTIPTPTGTMPQTPTPTKTPAPAIIINLHDDPIASLGPYLSGAGHSGQKFQIPAQGIALLCSDDGTVVQMYGVTRKGQDANMINRFEISGPNQQAVQLNNVGSVSPNHDPIQVKGALNGLTIVPHQDSVDVSGPNDAWQLKVQQDHGHQSIMPGIAEVTIKQDGTPDFAHAVAAALVHNQALPDPQNYITCKTNFLYLPLVQR